MRPLLKEEVFNARSRLSSRHRRLFRFFRVVRPRVRPTVKGKSNSMNLEYLIGGAVSVLLIGYLLYALLKPEKF
jgi:K+-transporting ATPase KdpF subunit